MNLTHWKCFDCGEEFFVNAAEPAVGCPNCDGFEDIVDSDNILQVVEQASLNYEAPSPEFPLDENVLAGVKEPEIEFFGTCKVCEIPIEESHEELGLCEECYNDMWVTIHGSPRVQTCDTEFHKIFVDKEIKKRLN